MVHYFVTVCSLFVHSLFTIGSRVFAICSLLFALFSLLSTSYSLLAHFLFTMVHLLFAFCSSISSPPSEFSSKCFVYMGGSSGYRVIHGPPWKSLDRGVGFPREAYVRDRSRAGLCTSPQSMGAHPLSAVFARTGALCVIARRNVSLASRFDAAAQAGRCLRERAPPNLEEGSAREGRTPCATRAICNERHTKGLSCEDAARSNSISLHGQTYPKDSVVAVLSLSACSATAHTILCFCFPPTC